ncbi:Uncharacterised protein [Mycobacteroides abscessus subsp. abscessus]|nr:Uncharacterised protein [Mycobacteroides abscessus subsp. abscessus]
MGELNETTQKLVVADTGPLLCAGAYKKSMGTALLHKRKGRLHVPQVVAYELRRLSRSSGSRPQVVVNAASKMLSRGPSDLMTIETTMPSQTDRLPVRNAILDAERERAQRRRQEPKLQGHDGEVDAILLAEKRNAILITNDRAAYRVAANRGILVTTYAGLLASELVSGQFTADEVIAECFQFEVDIDCGLSQLNAMTLTGTVYPDGL